MAERLAVTRMISPCLISYYKQIESLEISYLLKIRISNTFFRASGLTINFAVAFNYAIQFFWMNPDLLWLTALLSFSIDVIQLFLAGWMKFFEWSIAHVFLDWLYMLFWLKTSWFFRLRISLSIGFQPHVMSCFKASHSLDNFDVFAGWKECYGHVFVVGLVAGLARWPLMLPEFQLIFQVFLLRCRSQVEFQWIFQVFLFRGKFLDALGLPGLHCRCDCFVICFSLPGSSRSSVAWVFYE